MSPFEGKTIIFGVSKFYHLNKMFESELKRLGFNTIDISIIAHDFRLTGVFRRIKKFVGKRILKREDMFLGYKASKHELMQMLDRVKSADYVLLTRPDFYPVDFVKYLRKKGGKMIAYQWDGLHKFPFIYRYIDLFDRFHVFESNDLTVPGVLPVTNFFPVSYMDNELFDASMKCDVFYSGSYSLSRLKPLHRIQELCEALGYDFRYSLYYRRKKVLLYNLKTTDKAIPYLENMKYVYNSDVILDLLSPDQTGLSFRVFEAIGFGKKMITNNASIKEYDFYTPENILIWDNQDISSVAAFLKVPFSPYLLTIKEKYSFPNWIRYVLDVGDYTPLGLP